MHTTSFRYNLLPISVLKIEAFLLLVKLTLDKKKIISKPIQVPKFVAAILNLKKMFKEVLQLNIINDLFEKITFSDFLALYNIL